MGDKFDLTWHTFSTHGQDLFKNLMETQEFTDVTLISDDQHQYRVHKFILSACSSVFREILLNNPLNSSVYLRGIFHEDLEAILQFIYLGECSLNHTRMNEFLDVAKNLDIKDIGKNVKDGDKESKIVIENHTIEQALEESDVDLSSVISSPNKTLGQNLHSDSSNSVSHDDWKPFKCQECDYQATLKHHLKRHVLSKHKGITYHCQQCDYQTESTSILQQHTNFIHNGITYPCQQCDFHARTTSHLQQHVKSKHEGIKYPCPQPQCDYQATLKGNLSQHNKLRHAGI